VSLRPSILDDARPWRGAENSGSNSLQLRPRREMPVQHVVVFRKTVWTTPAKIGNCTAMHKKRWTNIEAPCPAPANVIVDLRGHRPMGRGRRSLYLNDGLGYPRPALCFRRLGAAAICKKGLNSLRDADAASLGPRRHPDHRHRTADPICCARAAAPAPDPMKSSCLRRKHLIPFRPLRHHIITKS